MSDQSNCVVCELCTGNVREGTVYRFRLPWMNGYICELCRTTVAAAEPVKVKDVVE